MATRKPLRAALRLAFALTLAACGDDDDGNGDTPDGGGDASVADAAANDAGTTLDAARDAQVSDLDAARDATANGDANAPVLANCLDRPNELPRPPAGGLPCELLPPGFAR